MLTCRTLLTPRGDTDDRPDDRPDPSGILPPAKPRPPLDEPSLRLLLFLAHTPLGGRVHVVYEEVQKLIDADLKRLQTAHPGGKVGEASDVLWRQVQAMETPGAMQTVPEHIQRRTAQVIEATNADLHAGYQTLDSNYLTRVLDWRAGKAALPNVTMIDDLLIDPALAAQVGPGSIFDDTVRLINAIRSRPDDISFGALVDLQKTVSGYIKEAEAHVAQERSLALAQNRGLSTLTRSVQERVLLALGQTQAEIQRLISPYTVNLGEAFEEAKRIVGAWEGPGSQRIPPPLLEQGGQAGRVGVLEPPEVAAARGLLENPQFVLFGQAHQLRSDWLKISRQKGLNVGNTSAEAGERMAALIDKAMVEVGDRLTPSLVPEWWAINAKDKTVATVLNSPIIQELAGKSLDDILNTLIMNRRPNDLKTVRAVLGDATMERAAEMWLSKSIVESTSAVAEAAAKSAQTGAKLLLDKLDALGKEVERDLFPRGVTGVRTRLRQIVGMEEAVAEIGKGTEASPVLLREWKMQVRDPRLWEAVESDAISNMISSGNDPVRGANLMTGLNKVSKVKNILFAPGHYEELLQFAHTARALEQTASMGKMMWTLLVRLVEHGVIVAGLHWMTGDWIAPVGYLIAAPVLAHMLTTPAIVRLLTRGLLSKDIVPIPPEAAPAGQERAPGP